MRKNSRQALVTLLTSLILSLISDISLAGNFSIDPAPGRPIIISVKSGSTASVYYLVKNLTQKTLSGYTLQGAPDTVKQNGTSPYCPNPVTLDAGKSCELRLDITGLAKSSFALCHRENCTAASAPLKVGLNSGDFPLAVAVGSYQSSHNQFVLLAEEISTNWGYPNIVLPGNQGLRPFSEFASTSCVAASPTNYCIAAGQYTIITGFVYPLLYVENSVQGAWTNIINSATPPLPMDYFNDGRFLSSACSNTPTGDPGLHPYCIAVGSYLSLENGVFPLIATIVLGQPKYTLDASSPAVHPTNYAGEGIFNTASCGGDFQQAGQNICLAAGQYLSTDKNEYPLAAYATRGGLIGGWAYVIDSSKPARPAGYSNFGRFTSSSCSLVSDKVYCVLAGSYLSSAQPGIPQGTYPWIATNSDVGGTGVWTFTLSGLTPGWPYTGANAGFNSVSCSGSNCVAVGSSELTALMAHSVDSGQTWAYIPVAPPQIANVTNFSFSAVSCSGSTCLAVGSVKDQANHSFGILSSSTDGGNTWTLINNDSNMSSYNSVNCSDQNCVISGIQYAFQTGFPYLLTSLDSGEDLTGVIYIGTQYPRNLQNGSFNGNAFINSASFLQGP